MSAFKCVGGDGVGGLCIKYFLELLNSINV